MSEAIILFAHGSRDPQWAAPLHDLLGLVRLRTQAPVKLAFLELMQPDLQSALAEATGEGARSAVVVPLFLGAGGHLKQDLPKLVEEARRALPQLSVRVLPPIGESESLLAALADWVAANAS